MERKCKIFISGLVLLFFMPSIAITGEVSVNSRDIPEAFEQALNKAQADSLSEKVSLDYKDADIAAVLRSLSYTYGLNIVTSSEIKGKITILLKDVSLQEALDAILLVNGYTYTCKGNIFYISPGSAEGAQLVSEPIILKYIKAADAQNLLRKVISTKGDIKVDEMGNMFIVTDYPANIVKLKELLKSVDTPPLQVLIEAKIVDITSKDLHNIGVTYQADYNPGKGIFGRTTDAHEELKSTVTLPGPSSSLSGGQLKLDTLLLKNLNVTATLDALVQDQKANLLASPSIAVLNNREARIIIGEKVPYKERTQTTTGTTETTKFIDVGTTLRVVPSINTDGYITISIHPEVSSVSALLDAGPRITTREADTTVRIKEGETIIIGGLIKQEDNRTHSKLPFLGDIPVLGYAFGNRSKDQTQMELAVFITPKIMHSREELAALNKTHFDEEAFVNIMTAGSLNTQKLMFEAAENLSNNAGIESRRKDAWQRKYQAMNIYESIVNEFPDGPRAAEACYRATSLCYELGQFERARTLCVKTASDYPDSSYASLARKLYSSIEDAMEEKIQIKTEIEKIEKKEEERRAFDKEKKRKKQ